MDFDFLRKLPKSDLDDRTFADLVEECLLRIPRYCPEWTNYNPSDPGITLVELFAWLTDQMLLRFNQVPRRNYVAFLELLGVQLRPPAAARTEVTFYLSTPASSRYQIPARTEVATPRTETQEAVVFSTDVPLTVDPPEIRFLLAAEFPEESPGRDGDLENCFESYSWTDEWTATARVWSGQELDLFAEPPRPGNCFYLVFDGDRASEGNVLAIAFSGQGATPTGIDPQAPPRQWEAWNGRHWQPVLLAETDDGTDGFSFSQVLRFGGNPLAGADVVLHLPTNWPSVPFAGYRGRWLRCTYQPPDAATGAMPNQYQSTPRIVGVSARAIGGTVAVTQASEIRRERLGTSSGQPGQTFRLQAVPMLPRTAEEYVLVTPEGELPQRWQEVPDFAASGPGDRHYTLNALTGEVQFGPAIRASSSAIATTRHRARTQEVGANGNAAAGNGTAPSSGERGSSDAQTGAGAGTVGGQIRQYGAIPPRNAALEMTAYRTGGGRQGNVQPGAISVVKTAVPFVARLTNHRGAADGTDAESLDEAAFRVPRTLRTRDRAVTSEDFEHLALVGSGGALARARCLPARAERSHQTGPSASELLRDLDREQRPQAGATGTYAVASATLERLKTHLERERAAAETAGRVRLLLVPYPPRDPAAPAPGAAGIAPEQLALDRALLARVGAYLDERRLLGFEVLMDRPDYVGVAVRAEVALDPQYNHPDGRNEIRARLVETLYQFFNPIAGGPEGTGWPFGRVARVPEAIARLQQTPGVRYLGVVQLFELRWSGRTWDKTLALTGQVDPGPLGLVCSWQSAAVTGHEIEFL